MTSPVRGGGRKKKNKHTRITPESESQLGNAQPAPKGYWISCAGLLSLSRVLTFHVHRGRFVHKVHEELGCVNEDLITAVANGTVPPRTLKTQVHAHTLEITQCLWFRFFF